MVSLMASKSQLSSRKSRIRDGGQRAGGEAIRPVITSFHNESEIVARRPASQSAQMLLQLAGLGIHFLGPCHLSGLIDVFISEGSDPVVLPGRGHRFVDFDLSSSATCAAGAQQVTKQEHVAGPAAAIRYYIQKLANH